MDLKKHRKNVIEQKIGSNLLLLQKIEYLLKYIIHNHKISAPLNQINKVSKEQQNKLQNITMGTSISQYLEQINTTDKKDEEDIDFKGDSFHISFETQYEINPNNKIKRKENLLKEILQKRNYLVHRIIMDFDEDSHESYLDIDEQLDQQKDEILIGLQALQDTANRIMEFKNKLKTLIESGMMEQELYYFILLNESPLLIELAKLSLNQSKDDGWISLAFAGNYLRKHHRDEMRLLKEKYGYKTLKPIIVQEKIFELQEKTSKNMTLFRLTTAWQQYFQKVIHE